MLLCVTCCSRASLLDTASSCTAEKSSGRSRIDIGFLGRKARRAYSGLESAARVAAGTGRSGSGVTCGVDDFASGASAARVCSRGSVCRDVNCGVDGMACCCGIRSGGGRVGTGACASCSFCIHSHSSRSTPGWQNQGALGSRSSGSPRRGLGERLLEHALSSNATLVQVRRRTTGFMG